MVVQYKHGDYVVCLKDISRYKKGQKYKLVETPYNVYSTWYHDGLIDRKKDSLVVLFDEFTKTDSCSWIYHPDIYPYFKKATTAKAHLPSWL